MVSFHLSPGSGPPHPLSNNSDWARLTLEEQQRRIKVQVYLLRQNGALYYHLPRVAKRPPIASKYGDTDRLLLKLLVDSRGKQCL